MNHKHPEIVEGAADFVEKAKQRQQRLRCVDVQCEYCKETFKKGALKRHMQAKHPDMVEDETNFIQKRKEAGKTNRVVCSICDKEMRKDALTRHTKRSHS